MARPKLVVAPKRSNNVVMAIAEAVSAASVELKRGIRVYPVVVIGSGRFAPVRAAELGVRIVPSPGGFLISSEKVAVVPTREAAKLNEIHVPGLVTRPDWKFFVGTWACQFMPSEEFLELGVVIKSITINVRNPDENRTAPPDLTVVRGNAKKKEAPPPPTLKSLVRRQVMEI